MSCLQDEPEALVHIDPDDNTTSWLIHINIQLVSNVQFLQNYWLLMFLFEFFFNECGGCLNSTLVFSFCNDDAELKKLCSNVKSCILQCSKCVIVRIIGWISGGSPRKCSIMNKHQRPLMDKTSKLLPEPGTQDKRSRIF